MIFDSLNDVNYGFFFFQKMGYELPDIRKSDNYETLIKRKDPRQIFFGLQPGWIINLSDKKILKPKDPELLEYYNS